MAKQTISQDEGKRLLSYIFELRDQQKVREEKIKELKARNNVLQDSVEEFLDNKKQVDEIQSEAREQRKLIDTLVSFAEKASGEDFVDDGPMFRNNGSLEEAKHN